MILKLYDRTRQQLLTRLRGKMPPSFNLDKEIDEAAYYICSAVINRGVDWESKVQEYTQFIIDTAEREHQAEQIELQLINHSLKEARSPLLDVGAGWGRLSKVYTEYQLQAFLIEPTQLGCQLIQRSALSQFARAEGQHICFPPDTFQTVLITWVLHHDSADVPAKNVIQEIARVITPGGKLISIEPLREDFDEAKWRSLIIENGFEIQKLEHYFSLHKETYAFLEAKRDG
jgi:SAM-dependent methyltransferase